MKASKTLALLTALVSAAVHSSEWYGANDGGTAANGVWSSDGKPGWNGTGVPNGQGAVAYFGSTKKNTVTQDSTTGVIIGSLILNLDPTIANVDLMLNGASTTALGPVTFDQDGAGPGYAVMSNNAARVRMQIGLNAPVTLNDDLLLVNTTPDTYHRTFSISITAKISGFGNVTIDNQLDRPDEAPILLSNSSSDFEGNVLLRRGCAKAQGSKPYGKTTNTVTLGAEGYGDATLSFEGTSMTFLNPLVVSKVTNGRMRIFGESISQPSKSGDYAVTLKGGVTLNGDVVFDIPSHAYNDGTIVCPFAETVDSVISGEGGVAKENNGTLVFKKANTYAGGTVLKAGTLSLANGATLGTGGVDVYDGATLDLASDVTVASVSLNGKLQQKGVYAALGSDDPKAFKVAWLTGVGKLTATEGRVPGLSIIIR